MANDVLDNVRNCQSCAQARGKLTTSQKHLHLFPSNGPFELVAMDILGPFPRTKSGKRYILVVTDRYSKLTRSIPMNYITAPLVAASFLNNWAFPYGIPQSVLTDNGPQFIAQLFRYVCAVLGIRRIPITAYHPQSNGPT